MRKNVISVLDGAAGSCGKAKVVGEIATDPFICLGAAVTNCMPNAGHTFVDEKGNKSVFRNIPVSIVNPKTALFIGPGSAIDMDVFVKEYESVKHYLHGRKIYVHELVPVIDLRHKEWEREHIKSGSTFKGCGAVTQEKVVRYPLLEFFKGYKDAIVLSNDDWLDLLYTHLDHPEEYVLLEGAQGCDLSLNHSGNYPYVTSRNVSTAQMLSDSGISPERLLETIMVIRPFPIRISNITEKGDVIYSGAYGKGDPLTWTQVNLASMYESYPFTGDVSCFAHQMNFAYFKKLLAHCPEIYLKQLWGEHFRTKKVEDITLLEALELERLVYKSRGFDVYESQIIQLSLYEEDLFPNTIIDQSEQTSVTNKERRIFDLDIRKLRNNCRINSPYGLYLNFFQYLSLQYKHTQGVYSDYYFNRYLREYFDWLERETNTPILALGTGERNQERILKLELLRR